MIAIKNRIALSKMIRTGELLAKMFEKLPSLLKVGTSTAKLDEWIELYQKNIGLKSCSKGYHGYKHASCISLNDVVVHGVPSERELLQDGDLIKIDVCASYDGYCADMARCFFIGTPKPEAERLVSIAQLALDRGISQAYPGNKIGDISAAIEAEVRASNFGVVQEFAGHGIGKKMHEDPEILNYGKAGCGPTIKPGMAFAIEPMITLGNQKIFIAPDGWTVKTIDGLVAAHVEDTVIITDNGPKIITRV